MPYAHPTVEHFAPLFVTLGAASDPGSSPDTEIEGFFPRSGEAFVPGRLTVASIEVGHRSGRL
jgi:hypothetical protein